MTKLRPDRKIKLTVGQHQQLLKLRDTASLNEIKKWLESQCGIKSSQSAISDYLAKFPSAYQQAPLSEASCKMIAEMTAKLVLEGLRKQKL